MAVLGFPHEPDSGLCQFCTWQFHAGVCLGRFEYVQLYFVKGTTGMWVEGS